ncbi:CidA/LrgA family protein [Bacillus sp. FJAT-42376]|uniref:CidA/LrgA family protein n=1 Tax=Bacillus sp. FJAT-42376 TaxID=2014076 RepID=UPI000F50E011|nr:CidA/LrgA family protein [Bacillus sp. FJAT-42376]AZB43992.1 CidA/LrgA family protein [Bacillus sp. FJAT-42376]
MKYSTIALQTAVLFGFSLAGMLIQKLTHLKVPGSIIGMILLFALLRAGWVKTEWIREGSSFLLKNLTLLFVPGTVGLIQYLHLFEGKGILSLAAALISTFLVMSLSSWGTEQLLERKAAKHGEEGTEI